MVFHRWISALRLRKSLWTVALIYSSNLLGLARPARAQAAAPGTPVDFATAWSWADLYRVPGADSSDVRWLAEHTNIEETRQLTSLIAKLSKPEASQLLPRLIALDAESRSAMIRAYADTLLRRPPEGPAGIIRVAAVLARFHAAMVKRLELGRNYPLAFHGPIPSLRGELPPLTTHDREKHGLAFDLSFDTGPADTILAIVTTAGITVPDAERRIRTPAFDALIEHHSQAFYWLVLSRELLGEDLSHAASNEPLDLLYAYVNPAAYLHFGDVRRNRARYRELLDTLGAQQGLIFASIAETIAPYLPPNTHLERKVSLFFADWADGWGTDSVTAMDLEYYKDDLTRFYHVLLHETFHAAQSAVQAQSTKQDRILASAADSMIAEAFTDVLIEGTANYISARGTNVSEVTADSLARRGASLLDSLVQVAHRRPFNREFAQQALNAGVSQEGLFYWLGSAIATEMVREHGKSILGRMLQHDGVAYIQSYAHSAAGMGGHGLLSPSILRAADQLAEHSNLSHRN